MKIIILCGGVGKNFERNENKTETNDQDRRKTYFRTYNG